MLIKLSSLVEMAGIFHLSIINPNFFGNFFFYIYIDLFVLTVFVLSTLMSVRSYLSVSPLSFSFLCRTLRRIPVPKGLVVTGGLSAEAPTSYRPRWTEPSMMRGTQEKRAHVLTFSFSPNFEHLSSLCFYFWPQASGQLGAHFRGRSQSCNGRRHYFEWKLCFCWHASHIWPTRRLCW